MTIYSENYIIKYNIIKYNGCFGISIDLYKGDIYIEGEKTYGITESFKRAEEILKILSDNEVYPRNLHNIIDECFYEP